MIEDIPNALKDIWGKNDATEILVRIAKSVGGGGMVERIVGSYVCCDGNQTSCSLSVWISMQRYCRFVRIRSGYEVRTETQMLQYIANFQPTLREKGQLLLIDRTIDPLVPLLHPINYQVGLEVESNDSRWLKICW